MTHSNKNPEKDKSWVRKEISALHYIMLITSKMFIFVAIGILIGNFGLPYVYPLMAIGIIILMPSLYFLFRQEVKEEHDLEESIRVKRITKKSTSVKKRTVKKANRTQKKIAKKKSVKPRKK